MKATRVALAILLLSSAAATQASAKKFVQAGVCSVDISPRTFPIILSGGFLARSVKGRGRQRAGQVLAKIVRARKGRAKFTVILKDPFGNSTIISEKAKKRRMGTRELNRLKFGEPAIVARQRS